MGRTGRAGNRGVAYTFVTPAEDSYAKDILHALKTSNAPIPEPLQKLVESYDAKRKAGQAKKHGSGFGGSGFKFDEAEANKKKEGIQLAKVALGLVDEEQDEYFSDDEDAPAPSAATEMERKAEGVNLERLDAQVKAGGAVSEEVLKTKDLVDRTGDANGVTAQALGQVLAASDEKVKIASTPEEARKRAAEMLGQLSVFDKTNKFTEELEINDYPQSVRWKVTSKENAAQLGESINCSISVRGAYTPPGRNPPAGQRRLYAIIEGNSPEEARVGRIEVKRVLDEAAVTARPDAGTYGKYNVLA